MSNSTDRRLVIQLEARIAELEKHRSSLQDYAEVLTKERDQLCEDVVKWQIRGDKAEAGLSLAECNVEYWKSETAMLRELMRRGYDNTSHCDFCRQSMGNHRDNCELAAALAHDHAQTTLDPG